MPLGGFLTFLRLAFLSFAFLCFPPFANRPPDGQRRRSGQPTRTRGSPPAANRRPGPSRIPHAADTRVPGDRAAPWHDAAIMSLQRSSARALVLLALAGALLGAEPQSRDSDTIFERYAPAVEQIRIVELDSGGKASIGSAFAVARGERLVTNFHVIAEIVHHPKRYRAELVDGEDAQALTLLAFDVVNDLAVLRTETPLAAFLELGTSSLRKGTRLYSLGNPFDLGLSIVEGTHNGLLEHSRYRRIHFTGSLNPGMSGGPALSADGRVAGVNVATAGDQVSFLVPAPAVRRLVDRTLAADFAPAPDPTEELRRQLDDHQREYIGDLLAQPVHTVKMGPYTAPTQPAPYFSCWGDSLHDEDDRYEAFAHTCTTEDGVFVSRERTLSIVNLRHQYVRSSELTPPQFYALLGQFFEKNYSSLWGEENDLTEFRCRTRFVRKGDLTLKTAFCARRYLVLQGLYDVVFKAAALGRKDTGFDTALVLSGVSLENAERLARRHLEALAWTP